MEFADIVLKENCSGTVASKPLFVKSSLLFQGILNAVFEPHSHFTNTMSFIDDMTVIIAKLDESTGSAW
ncbi:hypothetical protein [Desulfosediminicola ganghwensis]|uniref:hypothetical protein n=1 Tax=Desulfosediminicola ganghwensis TaxID=2569540 RepID=UPI0010ACB057|nr:hypothetical protein [Desulfosediminicola ganghwensis]